MKTTLFIFYLFICIFELKSNNIDKIEYRVLDMLIKDITYKKDNKSILLSNWNSRSKKYIIIDTNTVYTKLIDILGNSSWIEKGIINSNTYMESIKVENNIDSIFNYNFNTNFKSLSLGNKTVKSIKDSDKNILYFTIFRKYCFMDFFYVNVYINSNFSEYDTEFVFKFNKNGEFIKYDFRDIAILRK